MCDVIEVWRKVGGRGCGREGVWCEGRRICGKECGVKGGREEERRGGGEEGRRGGGEEGRRGEGEEGRKERLSFFTSGN